eukprot:TRINITY_DN81598_c0_g1_i1.p1 TRINITY_DN81598_c0_g1~~TRINITY_DN81598_c0_g1_i1.p1  ORF type:complete len:125 (-),score=6.57 TRINITY_DN81598_c0_g1_i1:47-421(-)
MRATTMKKNNSRTYKTSAPVEKIIARIGPAAGAGVSIVHRRVVLGEDIHCSTGQGGTSAPGALSCLILLPGITWRSPRLTRSPTRQVPSSFHSFIFSRAVMLPPIFVSFDRHWDLALAACRSFQ